jgi:protocatechuate 3,4-dioxygenase beta subunit
VVRGIEPGTYSLSAPRYDSDEAKFTKVIVTADVDPDPVRLVAVRAAEIIGRVVDENGRGLAGVQITPHKGNQYSISATTDSNGRFHFREIAPASWILIPRDPWTGELRAPGSDKPESGRKTVDVRSGQREEVTLTVETMNEVIAGRVINKNGAGVPDVFVAAYRGAPRDGRWRPPAGRIRDRAPALTNNDGAFRLERLGAGTYVVHAFVDGGAENAKPDVPAGSTDVLIELGSGGSVAGSVRAPDEKPVKNFWLSAHGSTGYYHAEEIHAVDGRWALRNIPAGDLRLEFKADEGTAYRELEIQEGDEQTNIDVTLTARATMRGRIVDYATGKPIPHVSVDLWPDPEKLNEGSTTVYSDDEGRFEAVIRDGEIIVTIPGRDLRSEVWAGWCCCHRIPAPAGEVTDIGDIRLVPYRLPRQKRDFKFGIEIARQKHDSNGRLLVTSVISNSAAERAGLKAGDVIVGVDDQDLRGPNHYLFWGLLAASQGDSVVVHLEDGRHLRMAATPSQQDQPKREQ